jgi:hypothetical protein
MINADMDRGGSMKAERRDTPRIPIALEAILNYNNRDYQHLVTRDISLDGVFVHTPPDASLQKGTINIAISIPVAENKKFHRFNAKLVRATRQGAGFAFDDAVEPDSYEALLGLVFARRPGGAF